MWRTKSVPEQIQVAEVPRGFCGHVDHQPAKRHFADPERHLLRFLVSRFRLSHYVVAAADGFLIESDELNDGVGCCRLERPSAVDLVR